MRGSPKRRPALVKIMSRPVVYCLQSKKDGRTYIGYSSNLKWRIFCHNAGKVKSTKHRRPLKLLFTEHFGNITDAKKREIWWKSGQGRKALKKFFDHI
ncbi:MAG TPA: GIY-YIG nuclease family protein [Candidatus Paceibacterota bacterium]